MQSSGESSGSVADRKDGSAAGADTRERLLDAAEALFADKGFAAVTVRELTGAADTNLAAVNYHFGSKHSLYREVLLRRLAAIRQQRLAGLDAPSGEHPGRALEAVLRAFARAFLAPLDDGGSWHRPMRLLMREVVDPQLPPDLFETELAEPVRRALTLAIAAAEPRLAERTVQLCAQSFLAQLVHLLHAQPLVVNGGGGELTFDRSELVDHVVRFTIAAIDHLQEVAR